MIFLLNYFVVYSKKILTKVLVHINIMSCRKNFRSDFHALFRFTDLQSEAFLGKHTAEQHFQSLEEKSNSFSP